MTNKQVKLSDFKITNIVASADLGSKVDINRLAEQRGERVRRDECFPGAMYTIGGPKKTALIFSTGKVMLTGFQTRTNMNEGY